MYVEGNTVITNILKAPHRGQHNDTLTPVCFAGIQTYAVQLPMKVRFCAA